MRRSRTARAAPFAGIRSTRVREPVVRIARGGHNPPMPRILVRAIAAELLRTGLLAGSVLVAVIAFGATIKPLTQENVLSAGQILTYALLVSIPMLQYALPFAAGFAATLTYHRMTADNEVLAATASGIPRSRLLVPVAGLGILLALLLLLLTQFVIPRVWSRLERMIARDVAVLLESSVGRGDAFRMGDLLVWADELIREPSPPANGADLRLRLYRVAVADLDDGGGVATDVTAEQVVVDVFRRDDATYLSLAMADAVAYKPADGMLAWMERPRPTTLRMPSEVDLGPREMTLPELLEASRDPDRWYKVVERRRLLADALRAGEALDRVDKVLRRDGRLRLVDGDSGRVYVAEAARLQGEALRGRSGAPVVIEQLDGGVAVRRFETPEATLRRDVGDPLRGALAGLAVGTAEPEEELRFDLLLAGCTWVDLATGDAASRAGEILLDGLRLDLEAPPAGEDPFALDATAILARATESGAARRPGVAQAVSGLERRIVQLREDVIARASSRTAISCAAPLLMLLGAAMAIWLRGAAPLVIYLWAFLPAIGGIVLISGGESMARDGQAAVGLAVMWIGNGGLLALLLFVMTKLGRN